MNGVIKLKRQIHLLPIILIVFLLSSCHEPNDSSFKYEIENDAAVIISHQESDEETSIVVPEELGGKPVTVLGQDAFYQHKNVDSITLPESLTTIKGSSFYRCYSLKKIHIPHNVRQIDSNPFFRCVSLTEISVDPENAYFTAVNGVLFNKEKTQMIAYPEGKNNERYTIPTSVKKLSLDAFGYHPKFKQLTILSNVEDFPDGNMFVFPDDITLFVETNSAAEQYAKKHNLRFEIVQD